MSTLKCAANEHKPLQNRAATYPPVSAQESTAGQCFWATSGSTVRSGEKKQAVRQEAKAEVGHGW